MAVTAYQDEFGSNGFPSRTVFVQSVAMLQRKLGINWRYYGVLAVLVFGLWTLRPGHDLPSPVAHESEKLMQPHPIETLITQQQKYFEVLQASQSTSFPLAVNEYQRRYGRVPPDGFEYWFNLAQRHEFVLIDEFDTFMHSLEPFHGVAPELLRDRADIMYEEASDRLGVLKIYDGEVSVTSSLFVGEAGLPDEAWLQNIPYNMTVLLNSWDDAMVVAPWEDLEEALANSKTQNVPEAVDEFLENMLEPSIDSGRQRGWDASWQACPPQSSSRQDACSAMLQDQPLPFIQNKTESMDVCQNCNIKEQHGALIHPASLITTQKLVPIWSASKPSHFQDILYPSHYYEAVSRDYHPELDPFWNEKDNRFYWAGSSTGGHATEENWTQMQRQRLVLKVSKENEETAQVLRQTESGTWIQNFVPMKRFARFFSNVRITDVVQCEPEACEIQQATFNVNEDTPKDELYESYKHKFVLDIDGNAFSGRFYRLLQSRSVVVKQTIFKEWHDDRIIPWVHYIPLSTGFEELPEITRFMAGTKQGLDLAQRIARESTIWHNAALRRVDLKIAMYRMLLEYGRLMDSDL